MNSYKIDIRFSRGSIYDRTMITYILVKINDEYTACKTITGLIAKTSALGISNVVYWNDKENIFKTRRTKEKSIYVESTQKSSVERNV